MIALPSALGRDDGLISRYEQLREEALDRPSRGVRGEGLALLIRRGMSAWMRAWTQCTVLRPAAPQRAGGDQAMFPLEMHQEVAMILAAMVLYGRQEMTL